MTGLALASGRWRTALTVWVLIVASAAYPIAARAQTAQDSAVRATDTTTHTLTLGDAARLGAHQSATSQEAQAHTAQVSARVRESRASFLPNISGSASVTEFDLNSAAAFRFPNVTGAAAASFAALLPPEGALFPPLKDWDARGNISDTLFSFGAIQRYRLSKLNREAAEADASTSEEQAAATAANAYLQVLRAQATFNADIADSALAFDLLRIAQQQLAAGVGVHLDVTRAQAQISAIRAEVIAASNRVDRARLDLLRALGLPLDTRLALTDSLNGLPIADTLPSEDAALTQAFRDRPDLKAVNLALEASEHQVSAIEAERAPSLGVFGNYGSSAGTLNHILPTYQWGVGLSVPVFDGFRREGRIEEQRAGAHQLEIQRKDLRQQAAIEVRGAYLDLASAKEQVAATREQRQLTEEEVDEARQRFRAGVAGNADVIIAELALTTAHTQEIDALTNYQTARVALSRALGAVTSLP